jgi:hypothetical protein
MSLGNKTFKNNITGELVKVIDSFENIAILENKQKADVSQLLNPELYTEQIDPANFFNNQGAYNNLAEKIKSIPADKIRDDEGGEVMINVDGNSSFGGAKPAMNESAIIMTTEEDERAELARKYGVTTPQNDVDKQNQAFSKLLGEEEVQTVEVNRNAPRVEQKVSQPTQKVEDPIITMFKNVKRIKEFSISLEIKNKIPRPDFIEMMEDSYNTSIIDFLAAEFTDNILKNPHLIEDMIKQIYAGETILSLACENEDKAINTNKIVLQIEEEALLFSLKSESESSRFVDCLSLHFFKTKRGDCLFVKDYSSAQRKYMYNLLESKGIDKKILYRKFTTFPRSK